MMTLLLVFWCPWIIFSSMYKNHSNENPNEREIVTVKREREDTKEKEHQNME